MEGKVRHLLSACTAVVLILSFEKEQVEEIEKWYMQQPEHDPDEVLPGGH